MPCPVKTTIVVALGLLTMFYLGRETEISTMDEKAIEDKNKPKSLLHQILRAIIIFVLVVFHIELL
eukprot:Awhi_evm1s2196